MPMSNWGGGVVEYVASLKSTLNQSIKFEDFYIGRRTAKLAGAFSAVLTTLSDVLRLIRKLINSKYDVVHINPSFDKRSLVRDGLFLLVLRLMRVKQSLVFIHGWNNSELIKVKRSKLRTFLLNQTFGKAAVVSVLAEDFKRELVSLGIDREKIIVSTTMYNNEVTNNQKNSNELSPRLYNDKFKILFMSRFVKEKGLFELLEAFKQIIAENTDYELILAGDGPIRTEIEHWISAHNMSEYIDLTGYLHGEKKAQLLQSSDLFILPTYHGEGCPVAILEAMAAGLPILATPVGAIPDLLQCTYQQIPKHVSASNIKTNILRVSQDRIRLKQLGKMNKERATENYSAPIVGRKMKQIYDQLSA